MKHARVALLLAIVALAAPSARAHGAAEAGELEILLLEDEANEAMEVAGGYDITQVYLGESHEPQVGEGAAGDGLYFRFRLAGGAGGLPLGAPEHEVVVSFETPSGPVSRSFRTVDGDAFETDFDRLVAGIDDGELVVERAHVSYAALGLAPGDSISNFAVETRSDGEVRDRAPGGAFRAGVEVPTESRVLVEEHVLQGVARYVEIAARREGDVVVLDVKNPLKQGGQHVLLEAPAGVAVEGPTSVSVKAGEVASFRLGLSREAAGRTVQVLTDIGGRVEIGIVEGDGGLRLDVESAADSEGEGERAVPFAPLAVVLAALLVAARRRS